MIVVCGKCFDILVKISGRDYEVKTIGHAIGKCVFCGDVTNFGDFDKKTRWLCGSLEDKE